MKAQEHLFHEERLRELVTVQPGEEKDEGISSMPINT